MLVVKLIDLVDDICIIISIVGVYLINVVKLKVLPKNKEELIKTI